MGQLRRGSNRVPPSDLRTFCNERHGIRPLSHPSGDGVFQRSRFLKEQLEVHSDAEASKPEPTRLAPEYSSAQRETDSGARSKAASGIAWVGALDYGRER